MLKTIFHKERVVKSVKIALAAALSTAVAGELGLAYSATAGIITILSIQNTRRETLRSARNRGLALGCALILAAFAFRVMGFTLAAFACYLLIFALICLTAGWKEAIAADSVLITHFLIEQSMALPLVLNEIGIFIIGTGTGILINLHLRRKDAEFMVLEERVDTQMKDILRRMAFRMAGGEERERCCGEEHFEALRESLERAALCAVDNYNNTLFSRDTVEMDYIRMREQQAAVLQGIYDNMKILAWLPSQAAAVAALFERVEQGYHKTNNVEGLLADLENSVAEMEREELPGTREEFEVRAILFYILKQLEELLMLKRHFVLEHPSFLETQNPDN